MRLAALFCVLLTAMPAAALDVQVKEVRVAATAIVATIELRDIVPDRFRKTLDDGGVLHLRVQAELWESRPVWDRLVYPAMVRVLRLRRAPSDALSITDFNGVAQTYASLPKLLPVMLELGDAKRVTPIERYYAHVIATLGTLAEREADEVGDAVFGRPSEANGLGSLSRLMFRTALQISDYLQSVSAEARSRRASGAEILKR